MKLLTPSFLAISLVASSHAATTFNTFIGGNAQVLGDQDLNGTSDNGVKTGDTVALNLDGGGTFNLNTIETSTSTRLQMDSDSMGHGNDKWGAKQNWTFSLDQTISFDAL